MSTKGEILIAAIRKAAADNPHKIVGAGNCVYIKPPGFDVPEDAQPEGECIVGTALVIADMLPQEFVIRAMQTEGWNQETFDQVYEHIGLEELDAQEMIWIRQVQKNQDDQMEWGNSVACADITHPIAG